jgi:hypothetical protein
LPLNVYKKTILLIASLLFIGMSANFVFGYSIDLNAIDDAGKAPGWEAYVKFNDSLDGNAENGPVWVTAQDVYDYAEKEEVPSPWILESGGNIWSQDDIIIGESLLNLHAGTYRIAPLDGTYQSVARDAFGWSDSTKGLWWWEMEIQARNVYVNGQHEDYWDYKLGSSNPYTSAQAAFDAAINDYVDITMAEGGSLIFWIFDTNSIDNTGGLSASISAIPVPSTILLLSSGMLLLPYFRKLKR